MMNVTARLSRRVLNRKNSELFSNRQYNSPNNKYNNWYSAQRYSTDNIRGWSVFPERWYGMVVFCLLPVFWYFFLYVCGDEQMHKRNTKKTSDDLIKEYLNSYIQLTSVNVPGKGILHGIYPAAEYPNLSTYANILKSPFGVSKKMSILSDIDSAFSVEGDMLTVVDQSESFKVTVLEGTVDEIIEKAKQVERKMIVVARVNLSTTENAIKLLSSGIDAIELTDDCLLKNGIMIIRKLKYELNEHRSREEAQNIKTKNIQPLRQSRRAPSPNPEIEYEVEVEC